MELARSASFGGFSVRRIFTFFLTVVLAVLLLAISAPQTAQAEDFKVNWNNGTLMYDGHQYYSVGEAKQGESHGLPVGAQYYSYIEQVGTAPTVKNKAHIIYFAPGADPPKATTATYVTYDYPALNTYQNPSSGQSVEVVPAAETNTYDSQCAVEDVGWIICGASVSLAKGMDWLFDLLTSFIAVQPPVTGDVNNDLYIAWNIARTVANIAFIIAFLVIIYSQLTNVGVSNYGMKKLIPRLIIAAVAVNLSFYITAMAIDISNILGYSIQDLLVQVRDNVFNVDNDSWKGDSTSWEAITTFILAGGGIGLAGIAVATGGSIASAIYLVLPLLLGLLLTVLFVLLVLAARQAIIIILVIVAPLAFVAYLLPNTEKWFEKWRELFMTMLIFFPAFSAVFGGSQLAGGIIIQNATSIFMLVFGLAVQVAPLVITPLLLKLSGNLLGRIAGMINDPRKGLLDRTRNWSKERAEMNRLKSLSSPTGFNAMRGFAKRGEFDNRRVKARTALYNQRLDNQFNETRGAHRLHEEQHLADLDKERIENHTKATIQAKTNITGSRFHNAAVKLEASKVNLDEHSKTTNAMLQEYRAGKYAVGGNRELARIQRSMASSVIRTSAQESRATAAIQEQQVAFAKAMKDRTTIVSAGKTLSEIAGGIQGPQGAQRAIANALAVLSKAREETLKNMEVIIGDKNPTSEQIKDLARGISVSGIEVTQDSRAAAIRMLLGGKDSKQILAGLEEIDFSFPGISADDREELQVIAAEALDASPARPPQVTAGHIAMMKQGLDFNGSAFSGAYGQSRMDDMFIWAVENEKIDSGKLQTAGKDYVAALLAAIRRKGVGSLTPTARARLKAELAMTLDPARTASEKLGDSRGPMEDIDRLL